MTDEEKREAFISATCDAIQSAGLVARTHTEELTGWLRTVWLEARGESWGAESVATLRALPPAEDFDPEYPPDDEEEGIEVGEFNL